jgi:hypothetical protein
VLAACCKVLPEICQKGSRKTENINVLLIKDGIFHTSDLCSTVQLKETVTFISCPTQMLLKNGIL